MIKLNLNYDGLSNLLKKKMNEDMNADEKVFRCVQLEWGVSLHPVEVIW